MLGEIISGVGVRRLHHQSVPGGLGDVGSRGDGVALAVALHNGVVAVVAFADMDEVQQQVARFQAELANSPHHGGQGRAADAHLVNLFRSDHANTIGQGIFLDCCGGLFPPGMGQLLGVVQQLKPRLCAGEVGRENDGGSHHRAGQGTASSFIDTGDELDSLLVYP